MFFRRSQKLYLSTDSYCSRHGLDEQLQLGVGRDAAGAHVRKHYRDMTQPDVARHKQPPFPYRA